MNKFDIVKKIENFAPLETQETWDCSGWAVCTKRENISKIMLALTVTDKVIKEAISKGCDMIISHHPLFYVPLSYSSIDIYTAHTNLDKAQGGTTDTLIKKLGFSDYKIINEFVRIVNLKHPIKLDEFVTKLKTISPNLRYVNNNNNQYVQNIGFCAGSGSDLINELKENNIKIDTFVTGDLKYHFAVESDIIVFDIGHFESEIMILPTIEKIIGVDCCYAKESSPFIY